MLVHICCSVDSHFFLEKLQHDFPNEPLTGFFYDPNIHPYSEYQLRLLDVKRSCKKLGIPLIEGAYDYDMWLTLVRGLESEPEKGARCEVCFDRRFEVSAQKALELGEKKITTTLLVSPLKSQEQLKRVGEAFYTKNGVEFIAVDYRSGGGSQDQARVTKEEKLYRQDYCGCLYGLTMQRAQQKVLPDELFSPIDGRLLPASIEERIALYTKRMALEDTHTPYELIKQKFLNYRLFHALLRHQKTLLPLHVLPYSTLARKQTKGSIEKEIQGLYYLNRDEAVFMTLQHYNTLMNCNYSTVMELIYHPPQFDEEVALRHRLTTLYDLSPIIVVDSIPQGTLELSLDALCYEDSRTLLRA